MNKYSESSLDEIFDYSIMDKDTANMLQAKAFKINQITSKSAFEIGKELYEAQSELAVKGYGGFESWYKSLGFKKTESYQYINHYKFVSSESEQAKIEMFESLPKSLQVEVSKPSANSVVNEALFNGDIKKHKEYLELEKKLKAEQERNKQQAETIAELVNVEPEVIEKVVEVVPADYQQVKRSNESLANELERYQRKADELEKSIADIDNRNKFIEKQYQEVLNDRKEDLERKDKLEAFEKEMERLTRRKDKYSQQLKAIGDISKMNFDVGKLLEKISPFYYQIYLKDVVEDDVIHDSISKMVGSVRKWCDDMDSVLGNAKIIEGEIING